MERRSSLARRAALAGTALLLLVGLTGCDGKAPIGRGPVASVEGYDISLDDLQEVLDAQVAYIEAVGASETSGISSTQIDQLVARYVGDNDHTIGAVGAAEVLTSMIDVRVSRRMLADAGGEVTDDDRASARTSIDAQIMQSGVTATEEMEPLIDLETEREALEAALGRALVDDEAREAQVQEVFEANRVSFDRVCVQQLVTEDEASAQVAADRLDAGEDFVEVADDLSFEPEIAQPGDPASCLARYQLAGAVGEAAATVRTGGRIGPADVQGAWLIVQIWAEEAAALEDVRADIEAQLPDPSTASVAEARTAAYAAATVSIDPRYGTWDPVTGSVIPPTDPLAATDDPFVLIDG